MATGVAATKTSLEDNSAGEDVEKSEPAGGRDRHWGRQFDSSSKSSANCHMATNSTSSYIANKNLHTTAHRRAITVAKVETTKCPPADEWINKVVHPYSEV